jgi:hydrogenase-4 component F
MAYWLLCYPAVAAGALFAIRSNRWRPRALPTFAAGQFALVFFAVFGTSQPVGGLGGWLLLDPVDKIVLMFQSTLVFLCSLYAPGYLALRSDRPNRVFCATLMAVTASMTLVVLSHHLGLMWVGMEATTLATAPLLYFNRSPRSLEAVWKYLLIGSVGIALALLGTFFLAYAAVHAGLESTLRFDQLVHDAPRLSAPWLHAAFVLLLVGYGTKMGLAPMHTWKPDAYGEAPGLVGTLLAGGVTSCAFLAIVRVYHVCRAGPEAEFARNSLVGMGLLSMTAAGIFMVRQRDFKRMLAYSSVEHMGILVLGIGLGGLGVYGALLHLINNGLTKGVLFLSAGNIHRAYGSKVTDQVRGACRRVPLSGALFLSGFVAFTGAPGFGPFVSEMTIAVAAFTAGRYAAGGLFLFLLAVVFLGMGITVLTVVQGTPPTAAVPKAFRDGFATGAPVVLFLALVVLLGLYIPPPFEHLLREGAAFLEGGQ